MTFKILLRKAKKPAKIHVRNDSLFSYCCHSRFCERNPSQNEIFPPFSMPSCAGKVPNGFIVLNCLSKPALFATTDTNFKASIQ